MTKQTYKQYLKEQKKLAQKQVTSKYKKSAVKKYKKLDKTSKKVERTAKKGFKEATKAYGYKRKLSQTLMGFANANNPPQASAGRPKSVFKHTSPLSGKPVPAQVYYAHMRQFKNIQARRVEDAKERQIKEYAKRGIHPSQIQMIQERLRQQKLLEQVQRQRQVPIQQNQIQQTQAEQLPDGTVVDESTRVWRHRRGVVDTDWTAFGKKKVVRGTPGSMWN